MPTATRFVSSVVGTKTAQRIYENPQSADSLFGNYSEQLVRHYHDTGMMKHDPSRAARLAVRSQLRAISAPLYYLLERNLSENIASNQETSVRVVPEEYLKEKRFDHLFEAFQEPYTQKEKAFLRVSSMFTNASAVRAIANILNTPTHPYRSAWNLYWTTDTRAARLDFDRRMPPRSTPRTRMIKNAVESNATILKALQSIGAHAKHSDSQGNIAAITSDHIKQLSWLASTKAAFFEKHFTGHQLEDRPPEKCPFTHSEDDFALGGLYKVESLANGPWNPTGNCPENIPFKNGALYMTGAELRLESMRLVARETLWSNA